MTLNVLLIMLVVMACMALIVTYERKSREKRIRNWIQQTYGKIPEKKNEEFEDISVYWKEENEFIPEDEKIDDITWNDLEMDKVFGRINSTKSFIGEQVLYANLHCLEKDKNKLYQLEKGIQWCNAHKQEREELQYRLFELGKEKVSYYLPMFLNNLEMQRIPHIWVFKLLQVALLGSLVLGACLQDTVILFIAAGVYMINIGIYTVFKSRYEVYMEAFAGIIRTVKFNQSILNGKIYPEELIPDTVKTSVKQLGKLAKMIGGIQKKKQVGITKDIMEILQDYLIGGTLWDFTQYDKVICNLEEKYKEFMELYVFTGHIDLAIAVSSFRESLDTYCVPEFMEGKKLTMEEAYHPLVENSVKNNLTMKRNIILTGSNASGKSTFIKAITINMILAQSIHTCMAKKAQIPDAQVITSMSIRDDVVGGESYYMKEIKYLKRIVDRSSNERNTICTIDEILRGTNTLERIAASLSVMRYLNHKNCLVLVATHDLELANKLVDSCDMYYFTESLQDNDVVFDYKLKEGICDSRNAINLLSSIHFPEEIVNEAKRLVGQAEA